LKSVLLTRLVAFSSGHRYWIDSKTKQENEAIFGPWASPYNHGHNYRLAVSVSGVLDPQTGMVINIKDLDDFLQAKIVDQFHLKSVNDEIQHFSSTIPTLENLVLYIRSQCLRFSPEVQLRKVLLEETPDFWAEWQGDDDLQMSNMVTLTRSYEFAASHRLNIPSLTQEENEQLFGKCNNFHGHGHNYVVDVTVSGIPDEVTGMICRLEDLDRIVETEVLSRYDHRNLNLDLPEFSTKNPTSEVIVSEIFDRLLKALPVRLTRVRLHETDRSTFEILADEKF